MARFKDLPYDVIEMILLCIPCGDLAGLHRASLVCRSWRRVLAEPGFIRRHRKLHRACRAPVLGFIHPVRYHPPYHSRFVPIASEFRRPVGRELPDWLVLDCRHGRALFVTPANDGYRKSGILDFIVWDPLKDPETHERLPRPETPPVVPRRNFNAAVLCAADVKGGDHDDCCRENFQVVFVWSLPFDPSGGRYTCATVYSSETRTWSEQIRVRVPSNYNLDIRPCPSALAGATLYFRCYNCKDAFQYKLGVQQQQEEGPLSVMQAPPPDVFHGHSIFLMSPQGGGLGLAGVEHGPDLVLSLCFREIGPNGVAGWAQGRPIVLETLHPVIQYPPVLIAPCGMFQWWVVGEVAVSPDDAVVVGFAEGTDAMFVALRSHGRYDYDIYMYELNSLSARMVLPHSFFFVLPVTTFCVPVTPLKEKLSAVTDLSTSAGEKPRENSGAGQAQIAGN